MGLLVVVALSGLTTWGGQSLVHAQDTDPAGEDTSGWTGKQAESESASFSEPVEVQDIVWKYRGQIAWCYQWHLENEDPSLAGRVEIQFTIHEGRTRGAKVFYNETGSEALGQCFVDKMETWRWPAELEEDVVLPFVVGPFSGEPGSWDSGARTLRPPGQPSQAAPPKPTWRSTADELQISLSAAELPQHTPQPGQTAHLPVRGNPALPELLALGAPLSEGGWDWASFDHRGDALLWRAPVDSARLELFDDRVVLYEAGSDQGSTLRCGQQSCIANQGALESALDARGLDKRSQPLTIVVRSGNWSYKDALHLQQVLDQADVLMPLAWKLGPELSG